MLCNFTEPNIIFAMLSNLKIVIQAALLLLAAYVLWPAPLEQ